jgi:hypothetical protein
VNEKHIFFAFMPAWTRHPGVRPHQRPAGIPGVVHGSGITREGTSINPPPPSVCPAFPTSLSASQLYAACLDLYPFALLPFQRCAPQPVLIPPPRFPNCRQPACSDLLGPSHHLTPCAPVARLNPTRTTVLFLQLLARREPPSLLPSPSCCRRLNLVLTTAA